MYLALCLNITVLIVAVYGWFISNKNVSSSINGMVVDSIDCVLEFNFLMQNQFHIIQMAKLHIPLI